LSVTLPSQRHTRLHYLLSRQRITHGRLRQRAVTRESSSWRRLTGYSQGGTFLISCMTCSLLPTFWRRLQRVQI
jgi:hypothetical protein